MRPRPRLRKTVKWAGVVVCAVIVGAFGVTVRRAMCVTRFSIDDQGTNVHSMIIAGTTLISLRHRIVDKDPNVASPAVFTKFERRPNTWSVHWSPSSHADPGPRGVSVVFVPL